MDDERKYRQPGYQQSAGEKRAKIDRPRLPGSEPSRVGSRPVSRCAECGTLLPSATDPLDQCPKCGSELHSCKQCAHFDPGRRFECTQPIAERIPDKMARNDCTSFSLRVMVERDTSSGPMRVEDARRAFESLFRKRPP